MGRISGGRNYRIKWKINEVTETVNTSLHARMLLATNLTRDRIVQRISQRVTISKGPRGGRVVTGRSRPGQYPKLETGGLQRSIFADVRRLRRGIVEGYIGTPLDYGLILEMKMDRKLLKAGLMEMLPTIRKIITTPKIGGR